LDNAANFSVNIPSNTASNDSKVDEQIEPNDRELVSRCQQGDMEAFEILVIRYQNKVYSLAFNMLRNETDATDLCQESFVRAWKSIQRFKQDSAFYTWMYRITTNLCIDFVRKRNRRPITPIDDVVDIETNAVGDTPPSTNPQPTDEVHRRELGQQIAAAMEELTPEHRAVIQLREFEGLDYTDIAKSVGCTLGTVMSRLHYARKHLMKLLKDKI